MPASLQPELPRLGEEVTIYTYFQVREDAMTLYGFLHSQDRDMFRQLIGVNGIGPKGALGILSVLRPDDLRLAIVSEDVKALAKAPGIGNKKMCIRDSLCKPSLRVCHSPWVCPGPVTVGSLYI